MRIGRLLAYSMVAIVSAGQQARIPRPPASSWPGPWAIAQMHDNSGKTFTDQTLRQIVRVSIGGKRVRLKISNPFGTHPLRIEDVHVALRKSGSSIVVSSDRQ